MSDPTADLADIAGLDQYLARYGPMLAARAIRGLDPIHRPDRDAPDPILATLARRLYPGQAHAATAVARGLAGRKGILLAAEQGSGKTSMAIGACQAHARGRGYRAVVMCPDHLVAKWSREIAAVLGEGARVHAFRDWRDVLATGEGRPSRPGRRRLERRDDRPAGPEWYVLGRDQAKLGPGREAAYRVKVCGVAEEGGPQLEMTCPRCGSIILDHLTGEPMSAAKMKARQAYCRVEIPDPDDAEAPARACGCPLWQYETARDAAARLRRKERGLAGPAPHKWAPVTIIRRNMKGFFDYAVIDEVHESKGVDVAQANAAGRLIASARKVICLTGTVLGGYAWHLFPILFRLQPGSMLDLGLEWGEVMKFSERYGRIETTVITQTKGGPLGRNSHSRGGSKQIKKDKVIRPGVMPAAYGDLLMGSSVFLGLEEVAEALPPRPVEELVACDLEPDVAAAYEWLEGQLRDAIAPMLAVGDTSLLARLLHGLLGYPDWGWGWGDAGYFRDFGIPRVPEFDPKRIYPKERAIIDLCLAERAAGRKVWVYSQMTGVRDAQGRLAGLLRAEGLAAGVLGSGVDRRDRERWIAEDARGLDVALSHPKLVETGMELFDPRPGGANFATIVFYQTGYGLFTIRQASRRAWRIGQDRACRIGYMYYTGTMQERAMELMGRKMAAAEAIDGRFSVEGMAALGGEDSAEMALARGLAGVVPPAGRAWARVAAAPRIEAARAIPGPGEGPAPAPAPAGLAPAPAAPVPAPRARPVQSMIAWR